MWSKEFTMSREAGATDAAVHSIAHYIEDYIDLVENVPNDIIRQISVLHEHNHELYLQMEKLEKLLTSLTGERMTERKKKAVQAMIHNSLAEIQTISDDKLFHVQGICDNLDSKSRQLDYDYRTVIMGANNIVSPIKSDATKTLHPTVNAGQSRIEVVPTQNGSSSQEAPTNGRQKLLEQIPKTEVVAEVTKVTTVTVTPPQPPVKMQVKGKAVKRSSKAHKETKRSRKDVNSPPPTLYEENPADPDEPTYCLCNQISFGEMIGCDNSGCPIEWFHFQCVQLLTKPKGKWYCPQCRGDRSNVPKK
ncbi:Inhibitor of growth protein 1 [Halotydeus destructor]|nr:Inhibitor of growth protein 1 [Halotydeus destructor]